jgi:hypothetical protein
VNEALAHWGLLRQKKENILDSPIKHPALNIKSLDGSPLYLPPHYAKSPTRTEQKNQGQTFRQFLL